MIITNITGIGDPQIILFEDTYYCYATSHPAGFLVWSSKDLVNWREPKLAFDASNHWGDACYWAPEVVYHNGNFVMHYSARWNQPDTLRLGVAVSDHPEGPFMDVLGGPMFDPGYSVIDGSVLRWQGKNYLYYSKDCSTNFVNGHPTSQVYVVALDETLTKPVGEHKLMTTPEFPWELLSAPEHPLWNEGPNVMEWNGKLVMNYSANHYASNEYAICIAQSDHPEGPWEKYDCANPVLSCRQELFGAGHNAFFYDREGVLRTAFHVQTDPENPSGDRRVCIGTVVFKEKDGVIYQEII